MTSNLLGFHQYLLQQTQYLVSHDVSKQMETGMAKSVSFVSRRCLCVLVRSLFSIVINDTCVKDISFLHYLLTLRTLQS